MQIIPAIDLYENKVVRLYKGNYNNYKIYSEKPEEILKYLIDIGIQRIHIVDLNAARNGDTKINQKSIEKIIKARQNTILEIGGGIRTKEIIQQYINVFNYLILGTIAVKRMDFIEEILQEFPKEKFIIGVDTKNESIYISGWEENSNLFLFDFLTKIQEWGIEQIILTDIQKDGTLEGPNIPLLKKVLENVNLKIISSGGVSSKEDVLELKKLNHPNLIGVIIGKAFYEKKLNLREIL
ncbi:MAG: 1-(5-phosphoribosyl)-5-[(5-phosphoribosylamino)methylideneamino]imidazole-4-carboxamide isomerase [Leptonema sp. (in: bacteria)]